ncbi:MAG: hypothetical protein M5U19_19345 [Microthrixaceae bacterium]|nr:hypothetical protein [Microthrixaceae bacterium]
MKIDGLAVSIRWEHGRYVQASTRGDGRTGEDVTANVGVIESVPKHLGDGAPEVLEARGEIYMPLASFEELVSRTIAENEAAEAAGRKPKAVPVNPRNAGAGSLRQKDSSVTAGRGLAWWCYQLGELVGAEHPRRTRTRSNGWGRSVCRSTPRPPPSTTWPRCTRSVPTGRSTVTTCPMRSTASW